MRLEFPLLEPDSEDEADGITEPYPDYDMLPIFHLFVMISAGEYRHFGEMYVPPSEWDDLKSLGIPLDNTIVECYKDEQGRWRYHRIRDDKNDANHISTVDKVLESIEDRVSADDLIRAAPAIKSAWKTRQAQATEEEERKRGIQRRRVPGTEPEERNRSVNGMNGNGVKRKFED